jgi:prepilin-type N-terminal cleavage/methylation domain-containing protein
MRVSALKNRGGFTLLELLIVAILVAALGTISFPLFGYLRTKGQDAACIGNLRILQLGAATYMLDHDHVWPQMPEDIDFGGGDEDPEEPMWKWWFEELKDYGVSKRHWICPSEVANAEQEHSLNNDYYGSYIPTGFDPTPNIAFYWATQPWFIERGQFHGRNHGANIAMPDGSIRQAPSLYQQQN